VGNSIVIGDKSIEFAY